MPEISRTDNGLTHRFRVLLFSKIIQEQPTFFKGEDMKHVRNFLASFWLALLSAAAYAADKGADKADQPVEQASGAVVVGFLVFCVVGIAAWIYYTSKASKKAQDNE